MPVQMLCILKVEAFLKHFIRSKNSYPYIPKIPGIDDFKGRVMHTKYYKNSDEFRGQNVVCLGLGPSAADLALHLSKAAKQVTVCHKFPYGMKLGIVPHNVREVQSVKLVTSDGVITDDNERISCDAIILCTGYIYWDLTKLK